MNPFTKQPIKKDVNSEKLLSNLEDNPFTKKPLLSENQVPGPQITSQQLGKSPFSSGLISKFIEPFKDQNKMNFQKKTEEGFEDVDDGEENPMSVDVSERLSQVQEERDRDSSANFRSFPNPATSVKRIPVKLLAESPFKLRQQNHHESKVISHRQSTDQYKGLKNPEESIQSSRLQRDRDVRMINCLKSIKDLIDALKSKILTPQQCRELEEQSQRRVFFIRELDISRSLHSMLDVADE